MKEMQNLGEYFDVEKTIPFLTPLIVPGVMASLAIAYGIIRSP